MKTLGDIAIACRAINTNLTTLKKKFSQKITIFIYIFESISN